MKHYPYYSFHQSPEQRRQIGARGGRACARNRRARLGVLTPRSAEETTPSHPSAETATQAIAALDAQFPWLRGVEKRRRPGQR